MTAIGRALFEAAFWLLLAYMILIDRWRNVAIACAVGIALSVLIA